MLHVLLTDIFLWISAVFWFNSKIPHKLREYLPLPFLIYRWYEGLTKIKNFKRNQKIKKNGKMCSLKAYAILLFKSWFESNSAYKKLRKLGTINSVKGYIS